VNTVRDLIRSAHYSQADIPFTIAMLCQVAELLLVMRNGKTSLSLNCPAIFIPIPDTGSMQVQFNMHCSFLFRLLILKNWAVLA